MVSITLPHLLNATSAKRSDRPLIDRVDTKFDLLRSYATTSLLVMLAIGGLSGALFSNYLADSLLSRDSEVTQAFLQSLTEVEGGAELFQQSVPGDSSRQHDSAYDLPELVDHIATMPGVVRANLFSVDGTILWSTQAELIGKKFPANHDLEKALQGKTFFELKDIKGEQKAEYAEFGSEISRLVENYLPIWDTKNDRVAAVVEIYKAPKNLFDAMESARRLVWISVAAATVFLYATLFWIVFRANRMIHSQQRLLIESETMVVVGEMASAIAHSIRNPLAAIRSSAELTTESSKDPMVREMAEDIITEADRVEQWIRELLNFSRPSGTTQFNFACLDQILESCLKGYQRVMRRNKVKVFFNASPDIPSIKGDDGLLRQMFNSLLANALEAMPNGGTLSADIRSSDQKNEIQISITDTGHGIPPERLETLFETCLTTKRYGLGIGMLQVKRIVERHNGAISLTSRVGKGTSALIRFQVV